VGPTGDVPERLEPALARDKGDILGLGALEQPTEPATERLGPAIHRALAEGIHALAFLEDEDPLGPELNVHDGSTPSAAGDGAHHPPRGKCPRVLADNCSPRWALRRSSRPNEAQNR
jgi:hypothetical protein